MKVNTTRLDMTNPFAQQQQMSAKVMNALSRHPTLMHAKLMEQLVAPDSARMHAVEISSAMTPTHPSHDVVPEMATIQQPVQLLFRRRRVMRPLKWQSRMVLMGLRLSKSVSKQWRTSKKQMTRQLHQQMHRIARRYNLTSLKV
jgi:hypothetical protein